MEIKDYIRYKEDGIQKIGRIEKISATLADDAMIIEVDNGDVITSDDVLKSDKKIIREIEVGDYVNGCMVVNKNDDTIQIIQIIIPFDLKESDIKNIVTREQFEAMRYVVKED